MFQDLSLLKWHVSSLPAQVASFVLRVKQHGKLIDCKEMKMHLYVWKIIHFIQAQLSLQ